MESMGLLDRLGTAGSIVLLGVLFALLLALVFAWIVLPLAFFGSRSALRELVRAHEESNRLLAELRDELRNHKVEPVEGHGLGPGTPGDPDP